MREDVKGVGRKLHNEEFLLQVLLGYCGTQGRREFHTGFWWENLKKTDHRPHSRLTR
jgi:hypothetical protein